MKKITKINITIILILSIIISYGSVIISKAAESELTLTPKPETNNIHLKWTGPQNSSYKVYQKKPGSNNFETIGSIFGWTNRDCSKVSTFKSLDGRPEQLQKDLMLQIFRLMGKIQLQVGK